eukprot:gene25294-biopygen10498
MEKTFFQTPCTYTQVSAVHYVAVRGTIYLHSSQCSALCTAYRYVAMDTNTKNHQRNSLSRGRSGFKTTGADFAGVCKKAGWHEKTGARSVDVTVGSLLNRNFVCASRLGHQRTRARMRLAEIRFMVARIIRRRHVSLRFCGHNAARVPSNDFSTAVTR